MTILNVDVDLAKHVFASHDVNEAGKAELERPAVPCDKCHAFAALPFCDLPGFFEPAIPRERLNVILRKGEEANAAGQEDFKERYRQRVPHDLTEPAMKLSM